MNHLPCSYCHQTSAVHTCGLNRTGSQRYRCQACQRYFTPEPKPAGYAMTVRKQALQLYWEGTSFRAIGRLLSMHHQTVSNWATQAAQALPPSVTDTTPTQTIEVDELYTYVGQKKTTST